jgi:hypothetical protein
MMGSVFRTNKEVPTEMEIPVAMRRAFLGLVLAVSFLAPAAWPKDVKEPKKPIFIASGLDFSQIDTICIAPTIDLRPDKTQPLFLSGSGEHVSWWSQKMRLENKMRLVSADHTVAGALTSLGYKTASCDLVSATLDDLKAPSDGWLSKLNFGNAQWLFVMAVEYVKTPYQAHDNLLLLLRNGQAGGKSHAVVSGYLFERQAAGGRLVWRDKTVGVDPGAGEGTYVHADEAGMKLTESVQAIMAGADSLVAEFNRGRRPVPYFYESTETETFGVTCNAVWAALKDTFKNPGTFNRNFMYEVIQSDDSDMNIVYGHILTDQNEIDAAAQNRMGYTALKPRGNECSMQITGEGSFGYRADVKWLTKSVRAALSK